MEKMSKYLSPRVIFGSRGRKFFVSDLILIAVNAHVFSDQTELNTRNQNVILCLISKFLTVSSIPINSNSGDVAVELPPS